MLVLRSAYDRLALMLKSARDDATSAYDRLDQALSENGRLIDELSKANERLEMMSVCVIDTLREALNIGTPDRLAPFNPHADPEPERPEMPAVVRQAIDQTFPRDQVIKQANEAYAWDQQERWSNDAERLADEIRNGATV